MKRGFKVTLMTVAAAMLGLQAMAMAPVIGEIPSPIVGAQIYATGTTPFIFGDALDLNDAKYVSDDTTPVDQIKWSYAITGTPKYAINGVDPINVSTEDPTTPGAKQINNQVLKSETNPDGKANTITIRNISLSPFTGTGATPSGLGIIDSQAVTLFASDGTTYSSKSIMFYSDNGGSSRLSGVPTGLQMTPVVTHNFATGTNNWTFTDHGGTTSSTSGGLCFSSGLTAAGYGEWVSAYGLLPLTDNAVYRIRADLNFTATSNAKVPFWDVVINNYNGTNGLNLFGGDCYWLDNENGANAIKSTKTQFEMWWCPTPIQTATWKSTVFTAANDANNDAFLQFRMLDTNNGIGADKAAGQICMSGLTIDKIDLASLTPASALTQVWNQAGFSASNTTANLLVTGGGATFSGGAITLTANAAGQGTEYGTVTPGISVLDLTKPATIADDYPITWDANTLYMITANLSAPDANSEANPFDVFWLAMDSPTNEVIAESYVTGSLGHVAMPKAGTPQTYTTFFFSGNGSNTAVTGAKALRPKLAVANQPGLTFTPNTGSLRINSMTVNKVARPQ